MEKPNKYEIFAYCSKNYEDAYEFVIDSWIHQKNVEKITIYTDWKLKTNKDKVEIIPMFKPSKDWIIGTGRRLNVIHHFSEYNKKTNKNILFLDIDCLIIQDVEEVFNQPFDIAISRLNSKERYTNKTATAGLWFARLTPGYFNFICDWFKLASGMKCKGIGLKNNLISYVQYSFTDIARKKTNRYNVLPIDEKIYNSEHSIDSKWCELIKKYKPKILHFKGRRFRKKELVKKVISLTK